MEGTTLSNYEICMKYMKNSIKKDKCTEQLTDNMRED